MLRLSLAIANSAFCFAGSKLQETPVRIDSGVAEASLIRKVDLIYPPVAKAEMEGTAGLEATIDKNVKNKSVKIVHDRPLLADAVMPRNSSCQTIADPESLLTSIADAERRSKMSTEVLRLMLPCPGATVSTDAIVRAFDAGFSPDQLDLISQTFQVQTLVAKDIIQLTRTAATNISKDRILSSKPSITVNAADFLKIDIQGLTSPQVAFVARHISLQMTEADLVPLLENVGSESNRAALLRQCLPFTMLTNEASVAALTHYRDRADLIGKISIADEALIAYALKNGFGPEALSFFAKLGRAGLMSVFSRLQSNGVSDSVILDFVNATSGIYMESRDVDLLSRSSLPDQQINRALRTINHPPLQLALSTVVGLKRKGVDDQVILALTKENDGNLRLPIPPTITAPNYDDPLSKMDALSGGTGLEWSRPWLRRRRWRRRLPHRR